MKSYSFFIALFSLLALMPASLAHHEGSTPQLPPEATPTTDLTILWVIGGVVLGSIVIIALLSIFSSKSDHK